MLDLVGYSTFPKEMVVAQARLDQAFGVILTVPWWALGGVAMVATFGFMYVTWPRDLKRDPTPAPATQALAQPATVKRPAAMPADAPSANDQSLNIMGQIGQEPDYNLWRTFETAQIAELASVCAGEDPGYSLLNKGAAPYKQHIKDGVQSGAIRRADGGRGQAGASQSPGNPGESETAHPPLSDLSVVIVDDVRKYFASKGVENKLFL